MSALKHLNNGVTPVRPDAAEVAAAVSAAAAERWRFHSIQDAFTPRPPIDYLIDTVFSAGSLNIVYGAPGTFKTMLMIDAALAVMAGRVWLPPMKDTTGTGFKTKAAPVMLIDFDSGLRRTSERIEALAKANRIDRNSAGRFDYVSMPTPWLIASQRSSVLQLAEEIKARGSRFVVIDNLGVITGGIDENSSEMVAVMSNLRWLTETTGACVTLIHHERKSHGEARKSGDALRGHSSINAAIDLALLVEREGSSRILTVRSTKTRDVDVVPFSAEFNFKHKPGSSELDVAYFFGVFELGDDNSDRAVENAILQSFTGGRETELNSRQLIEAVKAVQLHAGQNRIRALANSLVARKKLGIKRGNRNAMVYFGL